MSRRWVKTFKPRFAPLVEAGTKCQTIRPTPKRPQDWPQIGDMLDARAWTGAPYRSKQRPLRFERITNVCQVYIHADGAYEFERRWPSGHPMPSCSYHGLNAFARYDGFKDWREMRDWFDSTHGLPFEGILIEWEVSKI